MPAPFRKHARGIEGFLFPATYEFTPKTTAKQLVEDQIDHFNDNWAKVDQRYAKKKQLTPYDVLIIASMVEKETIAPDERPKVAAVIYNRLKARMPLGIDATIRYGLDIPGTESLHVSQLESNNPYNTRNRTGLPPTPIANPGLASMQAAAHPAKVKYLYFVRKPDRVHHFFTASESEFFAESLRVRLRLRLSCVDNTSLYPAALLLRATIACVESTQGSLMITARQASSGCSGIPRWDRSRRGCRTRRLRRARSMSRTSRSASRPSSSRTPCEGSSPSAFSAPT